MPRPGSISEPDLLWSRVCCVLTTYCSTAQIYIQR